MRTSADRNDYNCTIVAAFERAWAIHPPDTDELHNGRGNVEAIGKFIRPGASKLFLIATLLTSCADSVVVPRLHTVQPWNVVSGNHQVGRPGEALPEPLTVRVVNGSGTPVEGYMVVFRVTSGGGRVFGGATLTDASGLAREIWTLGNNVAREQSLEARAVDQESGEPLVLARFTATFGGDTTPPDGVGKADPAQLVIARGQRPGAGSYGRSLTAGQTYTDPVTGVRVLKLTDAKTPVSNGSMDHGYSEGGPNISQAWLGADGEIYYTLKVGRRLVDLRYSTLSTGNWRMHPGRGEIGFVFSLNPATPRIGYYQDGDQVQRYNTATNQTENTGNWPWTPEGGESLVWLQNNLNDKWFVGMFNSNQTTVAFRPSDGFERTITEARVGATVDEPHIDRELSYVYISTEEDSHANTYVNLETGALRVPRDVGHQADDNVAPLRGLLVGVGHWQYGSMYYFDPVNDRTVDFVAIDRVIGTPGNWHQAGQWVSTTAAAPTSGLSLMRMALMTQALTFDRA